MRKFPLSQGEVDGSNDGFIDAIFEFGSEFRHRSTEDRPGYINRVIRGGFPEAVARQGRRRETFFDNYVSDIINRDVIQLWESGAQ